jgi:hypothetical protein
VKPKAARILNDRSYEKKTVRVAGFRNESRRRFSKKEMCPYIMKEKASASSLTYWISPAATWRNERMCAHHTSFYTIVVIKKSIVGDNSTFI